MFYLTIVNKTRSHFGWQNSTCIRVLTSDVIITLHNFYWRCIGHNNEESHNVTNALLLELTHDKSTVTKQMYIINMKDILS